jgi:RNA polymerase sigma-70 factor (ECF subfamily)
MDLKEKEQFLAIQKGDISLYGEWVVAHKNRIFGTLVAILQNTQDAEDLTQEVFLKAYRNINHFEGKSSFYTWLYRIAINTAIDFQRKNKKMVKVAIDESKGGLDLLMKDAVNPKDLGFAPEQHELHAALTASIQALDVDSRSILQMREVEGFSYAEIAKMLGIKIGTVMSRLFHARKKAREKLEQSGVL